MPTAEFTHLRTIADPIGSGDADAALANSDIPAIAAGDINKGSISTGPEERTLEFYYDIVDASGASQAGATMTVDLAVARRNTVLVRRGAANVRTEHTVDSLYETVRPRRVVTLRCAQADRLTILVGNIVNPVANVAIEIFYREVETP